MRTNVLAVCQCEHHINYLLSYLPANLYSLRPLSPHNDVPRWPLWCLLKCFDGLFVAGTARPHTVLRPALNNRRHINLSLSLSLSSSLSLSLSLSHSLSLSFSIFLSLPLCLPLPPSLSLSFSLSIFLSLPLYLPFSPSLYPSLSLSISLSIFLFLSPSLSLSIFLSLSPSLSLSHLILMVYTVLGCRPLSMAWLTVPYTCSLPAVCQLEAEYGLYRMV